MLTRLIARNFKRFGEVDIELGQTVVLIGPNNSGKTTALQALALWATGLRQWNAKRGGKASPEKRPGVTINRRDLVSVPVPTANLLWRGRRVREGHQVEEKTKDGKKKTLTSNIRIDVTVEGVAEDNLWSCGLEFDYANEESILCRPLRLPGCEDRPVKEARFSEIPKAAGEVRVAYLPPMSGLADREFLKQQGEVDFLIGQGQTAQVLRNLCFRVYQERGRKVWGEMADRVCRLFGVRVLPPNCTEHAEITLEYKEDGSRLDVSSSGRGLQQTLLLLGHLYANPKTVLLLDEPDAHLEILRQHQTYRLLTEVAQEQGCQIIAASHSEVVLNEAADRDLVIAFVGKPHRIDDRGSQVMKALKEIGFDQYYMAEQTGWVLYLEGSTDLAILQAFARRLSHPAAAHLDRPFVHPVGNQPGAVRTHFFGLREAKPDLVGIAIFDRLERSLPDDLGAVGLTWRKREIESYLCMPRVLTSYAREAAGEGLFATVWVAKMEATIADMVPPVALRDPKDPYWSKVKATDELLDPLFERFFREIGLPNLMRKTDYHVLAQHVAAEDIDPEVVEKLDAIVHVAEKARPRTD